MPTPLRTPRINNNDDTVRLLRVFVKPGDSVNVGETVAEVETDKASFTVEAEQPGFVLAVVPEPTQTIEVGSVLMWLGASADESLPVSSSVPPGEVRDGSEPTVKAAQLLARYRLRAADVTASGSRLSAKDVEEHVRVRGLKPADSGPPDTGRPLAPNAPGTAETLTPEERGMLRTVLWQRQEAVPAYVELEYDPGPWERFAAGFQQRERLLINPLLALMAHRLARLPASNRRLNSTIRGEERFVYDGVNLGFTVQGDTTLYLAVVERADALTAHEFVDRLGRLQRSALANRLRPREMSGATLSFSSMARWNVSRHIPVLPPHTALIVAHAGAADGRATIGATYDHRVLTGFDALSALQAVILPEAE